MDNGADLRQEPSLDKVVGNIVLRELNKKKLSAETQTTSAIRHIRDREGKNLPMAP